MSDIPSGCNRTLIEEALQMVFDERKQERWRLEERIDEATVDMQGAVDIVSSLLRKIDMCSIFIADISLINTGVEVERRTPNPNVLFELGYAVNTVGWENIILVFNEAYGDLKNIPFDIQGQRIFTYSLQSGTAKKGERLKLTEQLKGALDLMLENEPQSATIKTAIKLEVDYQIMEIGNHIFKMLYDPQPLIMPEHILQMMAISAAELIAILEKRVVMGFHILKTWDHYITDLKAVKNNAVYSKYLSNTKIVSLIRLIEELEIASRNFMVSRFYIKAAKLKAPKYLKIDRKRDGNYQLLSKTANGWESQDEGIFYPGDEKKLLHIYETVEEEIGILALCLTKIFVATNTLIDAWDGAIIANPALTRLF